MSPLGLTLLGKKWDDVKDISGEEYAVDILRVREILQAGRITRVPRTPAWVRGVINLRGAVVPVLDLAVRFGLEAVAPSRSTCVVICEVHVDGDAVVAGILADSVSEVVYLPAEQVQPPPAFGSRIRVDCLHGMGRVGERLVLLLDLDAVVSAEDVSVAMG